MTDYTTTPTDPTKFECHIFTQRASIEFPQDLLTKVVPRALIPSLHATPVDVKHEDDTYSVTLSPTHLHISKNSVPTTAIPLAYVPSIIAQARGNDGDPFAE